MKTIEVFTALLPTETKPGKFHRSRWLMTREDAQRRGGSVVENTRKERRVYEPGDEVPFNTGSGSAIAGEPKG